jgi:hypothetical protein
MPRRGRHCRVARLVFPPVEIETGLEGTEAVVELGAVAAKDADRIAVAMAPSASFRVSATVRIATHALMQGVE